MCLAVVFEAIRVRGAVWDRRDGFGLPGIASFSGFGSVELIVSSDSGVAVESTLNPLDLVFALTRGVPFGEGRTLVTVADELSEFVPLEHSARLLLVPAVWK